MDPTETAKIVSPIIVAALGGGVLVALIQRPRTKAQASREQAEAEGVKIHGQLEIVDRTMSLNKVLLERLDAMDSKIQAMSNEIDRHKTTIDRLETEVHRLEEENASLMSRCQHLEEENLRLRAEPPQPQSELPQNPSPEP